jgi:hypothetical protein
VSLFDQYCQRCDVFGHEEGTDECREHWENHELPFHDRMFAMVGKTFKTSDPGPILYADDDTPYDTPPGTLVRLTHFTPDTPGMKAGNYWSIRTLDGKYSATQIYQDDLEELDVLDKLSLIGDEDKIGRFDESDPS